MKTEAVTSEELDSTIRSKISKIESGFKKLFSLSKSVIKKSNEAGGLFDQSSPETGSLSEEEESIAQQMSGKLLDYYNKTKTSSVRTALTEVNDFDFGSGSDDKMKPVEDWLSGMKSKLESSGGQYNREAIFNKIKSDIQNKSPEAYKFFFENGQEPSTTEPQNNPPVNNSPQDQSAEPKKDPSKDLNINPNKLFSSFDDIVKIAMPAPADIMGGNFDKLYLTEQIKRRIVQSFFSYLKAGGMKKLELSGSFLNFVKKDISPEEIQKMCHGAETDLENFLQQSPRAVDIFNSLPSHFPDYIIKATNKIAEMILNECKDEQQRNFIEQNIEAVKEQLKPVVEMFMKYVHQLVKKYFAGKSAQKVLSDIYKKFAVLTTKVTGSYDLEDIVAAMLVGGEKDKFFEHVYSYIINTMDSDVRTASDVMDKIVDESCNDPELLRKYFQAYAEGVECLLTEFVNSMNIPAAAVADALSSKYISEENLAKMSAGIKEFVERGATLEEQRAIKQFIDQYQISPELAFKLVSAGSESEYVRMACNIMLRRLFAGVSDNDIQLMASDEETVCAIATHINEEMQKFSHNKYSLSDMEFEKFGTINITIVDENGEKKDVSNKDDEFDLDLEPEKEDSDKGSSLNDSIDQAVADSEKASEGSEGDIFSNPGTEEKPEENKPAEPVSTNAETAPAGENPLESAAAPESAPTEPPKEKGRLEGMFV